MFDAKRALEQARSFGFPRDAGSEGEWRAAELLNHGLKAAGYQNIGDNVGRPSRSWEVRVLWTWFIGLGVILPMGFLPTFADSFLLRMVFLGSGLVVWPIVAAIVARTVPTFGSRESPAVIARRPSEHDRPLRVVFATSLDPPRHMVSGESQQATRSLFMMALFVIIALDFVFGDVNQLPRRSTALVVVVGFEICLILWLTCRLYSAAHEGDRDNRDGLATLLELARSWHPRSSDILETWFVANVGFNAARLEELSRRHRDIEPTKPMLIVGFFSPGLGPPFEVQRGTVKAIALANGAATSLEIPTTETSCTRVREFYELQFTATHIPQEILIVGEPAPDRETAIRAESIALAVQLGTEIVLRWMKAELAARQPVSEE